MVWRVMCVHGLSFNINCDPGLEFHAEVVCEDGNRLNELFY